MTTLSSLRKSPCLAACDLGKELTSNRARFIAKGDAIASLDCDEEYWENSNWTIGETYSRRDITCDLVDLSVPVKEITGVARASREA